MKGQQDVSGSKVRSEDSIPDLGKDCGRKQIMETSERRKEEWRSSEKRREEWRSLERRRE